MEPLTPAEELRRFQRQQQPAGVEQYEFCPLLGNATVAAVKRLSLAAPLSEPLPERRSGSPNSEDGSGSEDSAGWEELFEQDEAAAAAAAEAAAAEASAAAAARRAHLERLHAEAAFDPQRPHLSDEIFEAIAGFLGARELVALLRTAKRFGAPGVREGHTPGGALKSLSMVEEAASATARRKLAAMGQTRWTTPSRQVRNWSKFGLSRPIVGLN
jgi:hypothetical protein